MTQLFYKYQGTGNDFILIDNRQKQFNKNDTKLVAFLCDRRFGIGADGLILLENDKISDFKMVYYNADGNPSTMCGNGGRCLVAFAHFLGLINNETVFQAVDGLHKARITNETVSLQMQNVTIIEHYDTHVFLDTGSPHHVTMVDGIDAYNVKTEGAKIRNGAPYFEVGTNVNFVSKKEEDVFNVRTFERGVEDETFSCGTGVTAVALAMHSLNHTKSKAVKLITPGGKLKVKFDTVNSGYENVWLEGPAKQVFKGEITW